MQMSRRSCRVQKTFMTQILILYASLGSGHASAAKALRQAFAYFPEVEVRVEDAFDHASPILRETITTFYERLSEKVPQIYRLIYEGSDVEDLETSLDDNLLLAKVERPFMRNLERLVEEMRPDAVICVQQTPSRLLQLLEKEGRLPQPHYVVVTDVIAHSTWINYGVDGFFLPTQLSVDVLVQRGVNPNLLHVTGIPISLEIATPKSVPEVRSRLELPLNQPVVTLFGGGLQVKRVKPMVKRLLESNYPGVLIVVAGRNENLLDALADLPEGNHMKLRKLSRIDYVDDLVAASELVITKAGGLITSEVLARGTPLVIIDPFPGQEEWNADAIAASGAGIQLRLPEMVAPTVLGLLKNPEQLAYMRQCAIRTGQPRAALNVAEKVMSDLRSRSAAAPPISIELNSGRR
jgi:processive 1,2-diacylglycerol beta-glucosyltransferase